MSGGTRRGVGRSRGTTMPTVWLVAAALLTCGLVAGCGANDGGKVAVPSDSARGAVAAAANNGRIEVGAAVPAYAALSLDGDSMSLAAERGQVVLLNVWATWCIPCRQEMPQLQALHARYAARGFRMVGVSIDGDGAGDAIRRFVSEYKVTFPIWHDAEDRVTTVFRTVGVPTTFLIDRQGVLRWRAVGAVEPGDSTLTAAIEAALQGSRGS